MDQRHLEVDVIALRSFITKRVIPSENGCWLWKRDRNGFGYGRTSKKAGERLAHRISYIAFVGPIPQDMRVLHSCDIPACCQPRHLFLGSLSDNVRDAIRKGRHIAPKGELAGNSKLTRAEADEIKLADLSKTTQQKLATKYGVTRGAIRKILGGVTWR